MNKILTQNKDFKTHYAHLNAMLAALKESKSKLWTVSVNVLSHTFSPVAVPVKYLVITQK